MATLWQYPIPDPSAIGKMVDNELVLVLPMRGKVQVLNQVGGRIWELVDGKRLIADISAIIQKEYEVSQEKAEQDTLQFIELLQQKCAVRLSDQPFS